MKVTFLVLLKKSFLEMLLFLLMLLGEGVAVDNNDSSTPFDGLESVSGMSTEMFTERIVGVTNSNSDKLHLGSHYSKNTDNHVNGTEFDTDMSTEMLAKRSVRGFDSNSDEPHYDPSLNNSPEFSGADMSTKDKVEILEGSNKYIQSGLSFFLTCVVNGGTSSQNVGTWFQGDRNMDRFSYKLVIQNPGNVVTYANQLVIPGALPIKSDNYTCKSVNAGSASIYVHVFNGRGPITTTVKPVTTTVALPGQQSNSAFPFVPFPLLFLLQTLLWILQM